MGGRGASSMGSGRKGKIPVGVKDRLQIGDEMFEYDGTLMYHGNDKSVTGKVRANIEAWEDKRGTAKIEYAYAVDSDGNSIGNEVKGGRGSVKPTYDMVTTNDSIVTHIHPRATGSGTLGGSFSPGDLDMFSMSHMKTMRAKAKEGTYSISKTKNFDSPAFRRYSSECNSKRIKAFNKQKSELQKLYNDGKISINEANKLLAKAFNTSLIELHNLLREGQKTYGYSYTLESNKRSE